MNTSATCPVDRPAPSKPQDAILEIPLRWLLGHKPELFWLDAIPAEAHQQKADVRVADLWGQLSRGRIVTSYSRLMAKIPSAFIRKDAALAADAQVDLPLNEIVQALGPAALEKMRPAGQATQVDDMPDLFEFTPPPKPVKPLTEVAPPEPVAPEPAAARAVSGAGRTLFLQDVDVNTASIDELVANVSGINHHIAHQMVMSRDREGLYVSLQDLARVPGVGPAAFRRLTGQAWPGTISRDRTAAIALLGLTESGGVSFPRIVQRFREQNGFDGCVIVNQDGETMAESWGDRTSEALAAFVSYTMKRMTPHIRSMGIDGADFVTVSLNGRAFTMVQVHDMTFIAVHEEGRFSQRQIRFVQQVGQLLRDVVPQ